MVYKFRNKNLFMTRSGYGVNWHSYTLILPKDPSPETTFALKARTNHFTYLRRKIF